jgi:hypothetical protein
MTVAIQALDRADTIAAKTNTARFPARHIELLAEKLSRAAPADIDAVQRTALMVVIARAGEVGNVRIERARSSPQAVRQPRFDMSSALTALVGGLTAMTSLPAVVGGEGNEARIVLATCFPEGSAFTKQEAAGLWGDTKNLLERIDRDGLAARIDALVSPKLMVNVRRSFDALGQALGAVGPVLPTLPPKALIEACSRFSYAVAAYARAMAIGLDDTDEAGFERFSKALAPIDDYRVAAKPITEDDDIDDDDDVEDPELDAPVTPVLDADPTPGPFVTEE